MAINSSSTLADVRAAFIDNATYAADDSPAKCREFIAACHALLITVPNRSSRGGTEGDVIEFDMALVERRLKEAEAWLQTAGACDGDRVRYVSFEGFRD